MRKFIIAGFMVVLLIICAFLFWPHSRIPSDKAIQQRMVGTWIMSWHILTSFTTIATNGDYVRHDVSNSVHPETNWFEGTIKIRDGLMIDTLKKSSITNQPVPHVGTNVIIRLTDLELLFQAQNASNPIIWERVTR